MTATVPLAYDETVKPVGVTVSPDGKIVYIANGRGNSVSIMDAETLKITSTIPVGNRVWGIGLTADGKKLYAANGLSNNVSVIDTQVRKVTTTIGAGQGSWGGAIR